MPNPKNVRKCAVCKQHADKTELIRIVKNTDGICVDKSGHLDGRGVYIHRDAKCIEIAKKKRVLNAAFKTNVSDEVYDDLDNQL